MLLNNKNRQHESYAIDVEFHINYPFELLGIFINTRADSNVNLYKHTNFVKNTKKG